MEITDFKNSQLFKEIKTRAKRLWITGIVVLIIVAILINSWINWDKIDTIIIGIGFLASLAIIHNLLFYPSEKRILTNHNIQKFLQFKNFEEFLKIFDEEINDEKSIKYFKDSLITESFIIKKGFFTFEIIHFSEMVWSYIHQTQHLYFLVLPLSSDWKVIAYQDNGVPIEFACSNKEQAEEILNEIFIRAPFAFIGYSDSLKEKIHHNFADCVQETTQKMSEYYKNPRKFLESLQHEKE